MIIFLLYHTYTNLFQIKYSKKKNKKLKICYTGEGADEYFGGYGRYRAIAGYLDKKICRNDFVWISTLKKISPNWLYLMNSRLNIEELQWLQKHKKLDDIIEMHLQDYKIGSKRDLLDEMKNYDQNTNLIYALKKQDISGMMSSVEVRIPFINQDFYHLSQKKNLVEIKKNITKNKLRKIAKKLNIMQNKKIGFPIKNIKNLHLNVPINHNVYFKKISEQIPSRIKSSIAWTNIINDFE